MSGGPGLRCGSTEGRKLSGNETGSSSTYFSLFSFGKAFIGWNISEIMLNKNFFIYIKKRQLCPACFKVKKKKVFLLQFASWRLKNRAPLSAANFQIQHYSLNTSEIKHRRIISLNGIPDLQYFYCSVQGNFVQSANTSMLKPYSKLTQEEIHRRC